MVELALFVYLIYIIYLFEQGGAKYTPTEILPIIGFTVTKEFLIIGTIFNVD